jgi:hypothetical protein
MSLHETFKPTEATHEGHICCEVTSFSHDTVIAEELITGNLLANPLT